MELKTVPITHIDPAPYNPRLDLKPGDPEFEKIRRSIEEFGYVEPVVWNKRTNHCVGGNQRLKVLKGLGRREVEVVVVDLSIEQEKVLNVALNKIGGDWDEPKLVELLQQLAEMPDVDLDLTGFDGDEINEIVGRLVASEGLTGDDDEFDVDTALDESRPAVTRPGELLDFGSHRLLCGDSTDPEQVTSLMDGPARTSQATAQTTCCGRSSSGRHARRVRTSPR